MSVEEKELLETLEDLCGFSDSDDVAVVEEHQGNRPYSLDHQGRAELRGQASRNQVWQDWGRGVRVEDKC